MWQQSCSGRQQLLTLRITRVPLLLNIERGTDMTNPKVISPTRPRRMDPGALSALVEAFADDLTALGHTRLTVSFYADSARHFGAWLGQTGIAPVGIDGSTIGEFARHDCCCGGSRRSERLSRRYVNRARRFVCFLAERGIGRSIAAPQAAASNNIHVAEFQEWLKDHRGISERTIGRHGRMVLRLLPALGTDPGTYDARLVRHVILEEAGRCSRAYVKTMTMALRGYLRFLAARGLCRPGLDHAIPTIPQWRLSALPRYITSAEVEQVIASCDVARPQGVRDRAILLLLARLGLSLATADRLANCIALCCIVAWRVSWLTMLSRSTQGASPATVLTEDERGLLERATPERKRDDPRDLDFYVRAIARLGGYLDRAADPPPGTTVIWRGFSRLADLIEGARIATSTQTYG